MSNVYLVSLFYANDTSPISQHNSNQVNPNAFYALTDLVGSPNPSLEIRVGYMGICVSSLTEDWICSPHASTLARTINDTNPITGDPLNLIWIADNFRSQVVFSGLMYFSLFSISSQLF